MNTATTQLILVINCGSSSLKFGLFDTGAGAGHKFSLVAEGLAESLNSDSAALTVKLLDPESRKVFPCYDHASAIDLLIECLEQNYPLSNSLVGIGHRVVHGGEHFKTSTVISDEVCEQISDCIPLAPLHNPANLEGIELLKARFPKVVQVAVFDTAFHQTMPEKAFIYALPYELYEDMGIRRYGFHGTSHRYVSKRAADFLQCADGGNFITAHLGNGASISAISAGTCIDTSMGLTPLEGLVMGTRSGDIDPGIYDFLLNQGYTSEQLSVLLNKQSGLKGISKISNDMRTLVEHSEQGERLASLAIDIFCYRLAKYVGAMMATLNKLDGLIFTGGIGENAVIVREKTVKQLSLLGFSVDSEANEVRSDADVRIISSPDSHPILVINTDEEGTIARDTFELINP